MEEENIPHVTTTAIVPSTTVFQDNTDQEIVPIERIILYVILGTGFTIVSVLFSRYLCAARERKMRIVPHDIIEHIEHDDEQDSSFSKKGKRNMEPWNPTNYVSEK